jgi:Ca-activated chloride channel family protein
MGRMISVSLIVLMTIGITLSGCGGRSASNLSEQDARETLDALLSRIDIETNEPIMDIGGDMMSAEDEIPDIDAYPLSVEGNASLDIEIFSSTEKAGDGKDGWINVVAENFNRAGYEVDGKKVSVSIRPIASGLALDYIITGKYTPDAYSPANELWADMIADSGKKTEKVADRLAGNTAGILMKQSTYDAFHSEYGEVTLDHIINAALEDNLVLGYTNPYASSTGLNILTAILKAFDPQNPLSETAVSKLIEFQATVPPVAFTTAQMRESAKKGILDAMVMEYQAYINEPALRDYVFTPMGVRHDSPVYVFDGISEDKRAGLQLFVEFCLNAESQAEAKRDGFNAHDDYVGVSPNMTGVEILSAQHVWKENKDAGRPVVAVFVADISGSMEGTPLNELKKSLINASSYISDANRIGLVSYSDDVYIDLPIDVFTGKQRAYFNGTVKHLAAIGGTATYDAVLVGLKMLLDEKEKLPDARLMLFVLSDGEQNGGYNLEKISPVVNSLNIPIHTIGYNADIDELSRLSEINEGLNINADESNVVYTLKNIFNANL